MRDQPVVDGDLVRLGLDDAGEDDRVVQVVLDLLQGLLTFLLQSLDRRARLLVVILAERVERPLEVADLLLRLAVMLREIPSKLGVLRLLLKVLEHLEGRLLHRVRGAELVDEQLARSLDLGHLTPFFGWVPAESATPSGRAETRLAC